MTEEQLQRAIESASSAIALTPKVREGFEKGVAFSVSLVTEQAINEALGQNANNIARELWNRVRDADAAEKRVRAAIDALNVPEDVLDEKARVMVALANAMSKTLRKNLAPSDGLGNQERVQESVAREIAKAVSYSVWAWATGSERLPNIDGAED